MVLLILAALCVLYNSVYLSHCIKTKHYRAAFGTGTIILFVTIGTLMLKFL